MARLEVRGLGRRFGGRAVIEGLDLDLEPGEAVALRGPSGSGKSTLLRLLAWLEPPDAGALLLDGRAPGDWGAPAWRARVRLVPSQVAALPGTPAELAERFGRFAALRGLGAGGDPRALAEGWGLEAAAWARPWGKLSSGEHQRCLLALALAWPAEVLLLDEPTSALDPEATAAVEASLAGRTALWVTHDALQAERVAARRLALRGGRLESAP